jgi:hypothetical protein
MDKPRPVYILSLKGAYATVFKITTKYDDKPQLTI